MVATLVAVIILITIDVGSHPVASVLKIQKILLTMFAETIQAGGLPFHLCIFAMLPLKTTASCLSCFVTWSINFY